MKNFSVMLLTSILMTSGANAQSLLNNEPDHRSAGSQLPNSYFDRCFVRYLHTEQKDMLNYQIIGVKAQGEKLLASGQVNASSKAALRDVQARLVSQRLCPTAKKKSNNKSVGVKADAEDSQVPRSEGEYDDLF